MPSLSSGLPRLKPFSVGRHEEGADALVTLRASVMAKTMTTSAWGPLVMKFLVPLSTYSSPFFTASVRISAASEPLWAR